MTIATAPGLIGYYPEMGQPRPEAQIDASLGHYGKHWYLKTRLVLTGRGIQHLKTLTAADLVPEAHHRIGEHEYKVTVSAFEKLRSEYTIASEFLL
jgi:hypothetical protein